MTTMFAMQNGNHAEEFMKGFIVASVNKNAIKQNAGLINDMIKYTPIVCEKESEMQTAFCKQYPAQTILMSIPIEALRKSLKSIDELASKKGFTVE